MLIYYPPLITSAIFFAAIAVNLRNKDYALVFGLALLAIPSILFLTFLSQKGYNILGYILLLIPIIIVIAGYEMGKAPSPSPSPSPTPTPTPSPEPAPAPVDRIEPKEGVKEDCSKCNLNPCMCPYKPPM
jgi:hypothetical protein